jgi:ATP-dependent DNA helicase RecQ
LPEGYTLLISQPTGGGKSLVTQLLSCTSNGLTIVIVPTVALALDQYQAAKNNLINQEGIYCYRGEQSEKEKSEIIKALSNRKIKLLFTSPEAILKNPVLHKILNKAAEDKYLSNIVVDEAHIVTTWGKQFRPDYWYLGDHIRKLRKQQMKTKGRSFVIGTFTATAIYHGLEDMYTETINSLHMLSPITYLGYVKRGDIDIVINFYNLLKDCVEYNSELEWSLWENSTV